MAEHKPSISDILGKIHRDAEFAASDAESVLTDNEKMFEIRRREQILRDSDEKFRQKHEQHDLRKNFLHRIFDFVASVVFFVLIIVFFTSAGILHLSDAVMITMLTTMIANVIGCLLIAFNWLFPRHHEHRIHDLVKSKSKQTTSKV